MEYPKLTRDGHRYSNVHCGHVDWRGRRKSGCGKLTTTIGFYYQLGGCTSTVHFCEECAQKYEAQNTPDAAFHQHNIEHDESVFAA